MESAYRQEVLNVFLAQLLQERGAISAPENIVKRNKGVNLPDVVVHYQGLRAIIEAELGDRHGAHDKAVQSALARIENGLAHMAIAVVYPPALRVADFSTFKKKISSASLEICVITESGSSGFFTGNVDDLEGALRRSFVELAKETVVQEAILLIDNSIDNFSAAVSPRAGDMGRIANLLGVGI